jgi:small-conductance mechanosensitive channel
MNPSKSTLPPVQEEKQNLNLEISFEKKSVVEIDYDAMEEELKQKRQNLEEKAEELKDSEQLMNKIVKSFLNNTDELSQKFNEDLEKVNSLDIKLLKIQNKLQDVLSENAFYSKETRRLKVI